MSWDEKAFKEKLEGSHSFPGMYRFKFIVKPDQQQEVEALVTDASVSLKPSSGNKYVSVTLEAKMESSEAVLAVYRKAHTIEGILAL